MPSTYSSRLRLELQADGENAGTWGQITNRNLGTLIETSVAGYRTIAMPDANYTLTTSNGLDDEARYAMLNFTGTLTATREVIAPAVSKLYVVKNQTNQTLNVKTAAGAARAVPAGKTVMVFIDGTDAFDVLNDLTALSTASATITGGSINSTPVGNTTPSSGAFTTLSASGATSLQAASATNLSYTGTLTGGTGVVNIGSGQIYKSAIGDVGFGTSSPTVTGSYTVLDMVGRSATNGGMVITRTSDSAGISRLYTSNTQVLLDDSNSTSDIFIKTNAGNNVLLGTNNIERLRIDSSGNIGQNKAPEAWSGSWRSFEISGGLSLTAAPSLVDFGVMGTNLYVDLSNFVTPKYIGSGFAAQYRQISGNHNWYVAPTGTAGNTIPFNQAMTLTNGGNLLVGTTTDGGFKTYVRSESAATAFNPAATLDGQTNIAQIQLQQGGSNNTDGTTEAGILLLAGTASNAQHGIYVQKTGTGLGNLIFRRRTGAATSAESTRISSGGYFKASNTGSYGGVAGIADQTATNTHIFQSDANITVSAFVSNNTAAGAHALVTALPTGALARHFRSLLNGVEVYYVAANGDVRNTNNSYGAISDAKLKENVTDASSYLDRFMQVRFRNFNFIGSDLKQFGVIAQELEQVFPNLVYTTPDFEEVTKTRTVEVPAELDEEGNEVTPATTREEEYTESVPTGTVTKSVKYSVLAQMQGKVIQELNVKIDEQQAMIQAQQAMIQAQQAMIQAQQAQIDSILARLTALESK